MCHLLSSLLEWFLRIQVGLTVHKTWYIFSSRLGNFLHFFNEYFIFFRLSLESLFKISVGVSFKSLLNLKYYSFPHRALDLLVIQEYKTLNFIITFCNWWASFSAAFFILSFLLFTSFFPGAFWLHSSMSFLLVSLLFSSYLILNIVMTQVHREDLSAILGKECDIRNLRVSENRKTKLLLFNGI